MNKLLITCLSFILLAIQVQTAAQEMKQDAAGFYNAGNLVWQLTIRNIKILPVTNYSEWTVWKNKISFTRLCEHLKSKHSLK